MKNKRFQFTAMHIDVTRNSTDDFNLFHDKINWKKIKKNPFGGAIALGFQLLGLVTDRVNKHRTLNNDDDFIKNNQLNYSYYQIKFAHVVTPDNIVSIDIKNTQQKTSPEFLLSNRFSLKTENGLALIGFNKASRRPLILENVDLSKIPEVNHLPDRSFLDDKEWFIKHKFFTTSNAKNFLVGCLIEQSNYFDELNDRVEFPEIFPLALSSCALLERATKLGHDFEKQPMIYVSQEHCIDKEMLKLQKSNDKISMLVRKEVRKENSEGDQGLETYHCFGLLSGNRILYRSILTLAPLSMLLKQ